MIAGSAYNQNDDQSFNQSRLQRYLVHHVIKMMTDHPIDKDYKDTWLSV